MKPLREHGGWSYIPWSADATKSMAAKLGVKVSILSLSAHAPELLKDKEGARACARQYNEVAASLVRREPALFGFFAAVPNAISDTEACLAEIKYAFDTLGADGVALNTQYDGKYLDDQAFEPIWRDLDARGAVAFIHPTMPEDYHPISDILQHPAIMDFPHESGRTAASMISTGMKRRYPNVKIILSHGGGTLPILSERLAQLQTNLLKDKILPSAPQTAEEILEDAKSFYFDTALAGTRNVQTLMHDWAPQDRMLFGSDYPYCDEEAMYNASELEKYVGGLGREQKERVYWRNALELFPRLRQYYK